ncbi:hypothetical protein [Rhizobium fabae]|uniref:Uncharacterized protein n=1 Tax=Rhizobium fabae TaxID=573179 RepID=A0A7W6BGG1_9HYPH|nr:hypothetical protein [Rhizobium fabae]MBB3917056.1 hypothetical protein [Rhizobium fabae]RUM10572.1 hypothetical protein EFB14_22815 [Rhizobium fabae]
MVQNVRRVFDAKPEYLKASFLDHIRSGLPHTCSFITHETPPKDGIEVILQDFVIPKHVLARDGLAPCPICSPVKPKYVKGHLLWSSESKSLYAVGHCCGHGFFTSGSLARALTRNARAERRRRAETLVEANWTLPRELVAYWAVLKPAVRDLDRVLKALRVGLRHAVCKDIHRTIRDGGFLKVQLRAGTDDAETPKGLTTVEQVYGDQPVRGASILRGSSRGISIEANVSNVVAALTHVSWQTENDAVLWLCEQVDEDLIRLEMFIRDAVVNVTTALDDIAALLAFLEADNLKLINAWSLRAHGWQGCVSVHNERGQITIMRGGKRHRTFRIPSTLTQPLPTSPVLTEAPRDRT